MTDGHDALRELAVGYAFGTLDSSERLTFERHLRSCAECQQDVADALLLGERLSVIVESEAPPPGLKGRVLRAVTATPLPPGTVEPNATAVRASMLPTWLAIAASIVAIVAVGTAWNISRRSALAIAEVTRQSAAAVAESNRQSAAALAEATKRADLIVAEANRQTASAVAQTALQSAAVAAANRKSAAVLADTNRQWAAALAAAERQSATALADASRQSTAALAEVERRAAAALEEANRRASAALAETERQRQSATTTQLALAREQANGAEIRREMEIATAADVKRIDLAGQPAAPRAAGLVLWSPTRGILLTATNLPPLPQGRVYQLWYVTAVAPVNAGLVTPDTSGQSHTILSPAARVRPKAFALTIEPSGGMPAPTGAFYLLGSL